MWFSVCIIRAGHCVALPFHTCSTQRGAFLCQVCSHIKQRTVGFKCQRTVCRRRGVFCLQHVEDCIRVYWPNVYQMYLDIFEISTKEPKATQASRKEYEEPAMLALRSHWRKRAAAFWVWVQQQRENINTPTCLLWLPWTRTCSIHT